MLDSTARSEVSGVCAGSEGGEALANHVLRVLSKIEFGEFLASEPAGFGGISIGAEFASNRLAEKINEDVMVLDAAWRGRKAFEGSWIGTAGRTRGSAATWIGPARRTRGSAATWIGSARRTGGSAATWIGTKDAVVDPQQGARFHDESGFFAGFADSGFANEFSYFKDSPGNRPLRLHRRVRALDEDYAVAIDNDGADTDERNFREFTFHGEEVRMGL